MSAARRSRRHEPPSPPDAAAAAVASTARVRAPDPRKETALQYYSRCRRLWEAGGGVRTETQRRHVFLSNLPKHVARLLDGHVRHVRDVPPRQLDVAELARRLDVLLAERYGATLRGRRRFLRRRRQPGEPMPHYLAALEALVEGCRYRVPAMRDAALVRQLQDGCGSRPLRDQLVDEGLYLTWDRARKLALVFGQLPDLPDDDADVPPPRPPPHRGRWLLCKEEPAVLPPSAAAVDGGLLGSLADAVAVPESFFAFAPSPARYPEGTIWEIRLDPNTGDNVINPWVPVLYGGDGDGDLAIIGEEEMEELVTEIGKLGIRELTGAEATTDVEDEVSWATTEARGGGLKKAPELARTRQGRPGPRGPRARTARWRTHRRTMTVRKRPSRGRAAAVEDADAGDRTEAAEDADDGEDSEKPDLNMNYSRTST